MSNITAKLAEAYAQVNENQQMANKKALAKAAASSEKGKAAVTLPKAPWDKEKSEMSSKEKMKKGLYDSKMDPVDKKELKGKHADRDDKDIDNDGDTDKSDEYLHKRRKAVAKAMESKDLDAANADKAIKHDCATHVEHAEWGKGNPISGQHTIVETTEGNGYVTHYDVMFEHGIEKDVAVEDLTILAESSHGHMRKKKMKESDVEMNPSKKKDKASAQNADTMESTIPSVYARILEARKHDDKANPGSPPGEGLSPTAKKAKADLEAGAKMDDTEEKGHADASKAGRVGPSRKARPGDNMKGDKSVINPAKDTTK